MRETMRKEITFPSRIVKKGNGWFVPVPKAYLERMELQENDDVDLTIRRPETVDE